MSDSTDSQEVQDLLRKMSGGDPDAGARLAAQLYPELKRMAQGQMRGNANSILQPTALLNEAWMKIFPAGGKAYEDKDHFLRTASRAMRSILVDQARARNAIKRGSGAGKVEIQESDLVSDEKAGEMIALDDAIEKLAKSDPEGAAIAEMRLFGGLSCSEIAESQNTSKRTIERKWRSAGAALKRQMTGASIDESFDD